MSVGEALDADAHEVDVINLAALMELPVHTTPKSWRTGKRMFDEEQSQQSVIDLPTEEESQNSIITIDDDECQPHLSTRGRCPTRRTSRD